MKRYIHQVTKSDREAVFGMSNVLGKFIKVESNVPFSFYYSPRNSSHGPRVKPILNPEKMRLSDAGTLALCDDWEYVPGTKDKNHSAKVVNSMKAFFHKYLILFLLVWEELADDPMLGYYLEGRSTLSGFIETLDFYNDYKDQLDSIETVEELEQFCRDNDLVNMYGN